MATFKKYLPLLLTIVGALAPAVSPAVAGFWSAHPTVVASVAGVWAAFKWLLPSPLQS